MIDADGCPVVDLTLQIAKRFSVPVTILCDTAHQIERESAQTLVIDKGADSVDFALVNRVEQGDVVVTQDYGLAAMCLAKGAIALSQDGIDIDAISARLQQIEDQVQPGCSADQPVPIAEEHVAVGSEQRVVVAQIGM